MKYRLAVAAALTLLMSALAVPAANASQITPDDQIAYALAHEPGGYATGAHTAYWPDLDETMTSSEAITTQSVGSCGTGSVCAYGGYSLTGAKLSWSSCGTHSTAALPSTGSIADARSSGSLQARNGSTVVATAKAGGQANVWSTVTNVKC